MANLLAMDLPSSDEEDDDYDIGADRTGEREDMAPSAAADKRKQKKTRGVKRGRVPPEGDGDADDGADGSVGGDDDDDGSPAAPLQPLAKTLAKKAKIEAVWQALNSRDTGGANAAALGPPSSSVALAALCGRTQKQELRSDLTWRQQLRLMAPQNQKPRSEVAAPASNTSVGGSGGGSGKEVASSGAGTSAAPASSAPAPHDPPPRGREVPAEARAMAAAAIAAAKEGISMAAARKIQITETRRFAGQDVQVTREVERGSKEAEALQKKAKKAAETSGLDKFLEDLQTKKKVNIMEKSKMEWNQLKSKDSTMEDELERHKRSANKYLEKVNFLKKTELRQYELERDKRLQGDVRLRNRL